MKKTLFAMAGAALLVGGVVAAGPALARITDAAPGPTTSAAPAADWASTTEFMQVRSGSVRDGVVTLKVRPAKKVVLGESFETETIPGPWATVTVHEHASVNRLGGGGELPEQFVETLKQRSAQQANEAFDITFDDHGRVFEVDWLYVI